MSLADVNRNITFLFFALRTFKELTVSDVIAENAEYTFLL
jgi:hypothetical protein